MILLKPTGNMISTDARQYTNKEDASSRNKQDFPLCLHEPVPSALTKAL